MSDSESVQAGEYRITYKTVTTAKIDTAAQKKAVPDLAAQFTKTTTARRFCVARERLHVPADQARGHGAATNHHREAGTVIILASRKEIKEENMSWLLGISRDDRLVAEQIAGSSLIRAEIVSNMLGDIWEPWFSDREQRELDSDEAAELGRSIYAAQYMLSDAVRKYHLEMGHYEEECVQFYRERAKRYERACEAEELFDDAGENRAKCVPAYNLKDEDAIEFIKKLKDSHE